MTEQQKTAIQEAAIEHAKVQHRDIKTTNNIKKNSFEAGAAEVISNPSKYGLVTKIDDGLTAESVLLQHQSGILQDIVLETKTLVGIPRKEALNAVEFVLQHMKQAAVENQRYKEALEAIQNTRKLPGYSYQYTLERIRGLAQQALKGGDQ